MFVITVKGLYLLPNGDLTPVKKRAFKALSKDIAATAAQRFQDEYKMTAKVKKA